MAKSEDTPGGPSCQRVGIGCLIETVMLSSVPSHRCGKMTVALGAANEESGLCGTAVFCVILVRRSGLILISFKTIFPFAII
jgi:hypothetical protein